MNEWENEPDRLEFKYKGFKCLILRHPELKHLCGYVGVPKEHPYYGKHYDDIAVEVHCGLTYAGYRGHVGHAAIYLDDQKDKDLWYLGFDCAHAGDLMPYEKIASIGARGMGSKYRNMEYVKRECRHLARQLTIEKIAERRFEGYG